METLEYKHKAIITIYKLIAAKFGSDFFELPDFWEEDDCAFGLVKNEKLIYIAYDFMTKSQDSIRYYMEFEIIDKQNLDTKNVIKQLENVTSEEIISAISEFVNA